MNRAKFSALRDKIASNKASTCEIEEYQKEIIRFFQSEYYSPCPSSPPDYIHLWEVRGVPLSGNTWYHCLSCGLEVTREV